MNEHPTAEPVDGGPEAAAGERRVPVFSPDEPQPASAVDEHNALSEREDGVNLGGPDLVVQQTAALGDGPPIVMAADEQQPIAATNEHNALSEREDGTNRG